MNQRETAVKTRPEKKATSIRVDAEKYRTLLHVLVDRDQSFSDWIEANMDREIAHSAYADRITPEIAESAR